MAKACIAQPAAWRSHGKSHLQSQTIAISESITKMWIHVRHMLSNGRTGSGAPRPLAAFLALFLTFSPDAAWQLPGAKHRNAAHTLSDAQASPPPRLHSGLWRITPPSCVANDELSAIYELLQPRLWVGEVRELLWVDGKRFDLLHAARLNREPVAHVSITSLHPEKGIDGIAGALATEALCCKLSNSLTHLVGVRRLRVEDIGTRGQSVTMHKLICRPIIDFAADARDAKTRAEDLWAEALSLWHCPRKGGGLHRRWGLAQLQRVTGEYELDPDWLPYVSTQDEQGMIDCRSRMHKFLSTRKTFAEEAKRVHLMLLQHGVDVPSPEWFESFIALRWASGASEEAFAIACGVKQLSTDNGRQPVYPEDMEYGIAEAAGRWAEAARLIEQELNVLRLEASMIDNE